jgi:glycosyltransferase involved in cell wall biosynthesis
MSSRSTIDKLLRSHNSGEYFSRLVNHPAPHRLRRTPELVYHETLRALEPRFTVVTPTFNHALIIDDYIEATATMASLPFDWIIVDDGSEDGTAERAKAIFASGRYPLVARATIIHNPVPVFETSCDNLGFTLAETEIIVEIQSDIQIHEAGYDRLFLRALAGEPRPSAISGRCGHTFAHIRRSPLARRFFESRADLIGLCGRAIDAPDSINVIKGRTYRCETVNRGPWALRKTDLERHGYLDEKFFFLGNDDHDYHRRLFDAEARRPLYVAMSIYSPRRLGASRRERSGDNREVFEMLKREKKGSPAFLRFLASQRSPSPPQQIT